MTTQKSISRVFMERVKRTEAVDGEIHLHEAIIQHIQSFLTCKEAAQTILLCKSWYSAWATRPIVDLDQRYFRSGGGADPGPVIADGFLEYSKGTMRRYAESNLKIESFRLCMEDIETDCLSLVNELILDAMRLGACDLNVELGRRITKFNLPHEVLRSENLVRLSVRGCRIDLGATDGKVSFSKLKSLSLRRVIIVGSLTFDIASNCPLIEELVLCNCFCIRTAGVEDRKLLALGSSPEFEKQILGSIVDARIRPYNNLKCLYLKMIKIHELLLNNMSRSFPFLKELTLIHCQAFNELQISSPSLEFLSIIAQIALRSVKFDVPSLRKFTFKGFRLPLMSFEAAPREWESDITITHWQYITSSWLLMLVNFLMQLSLSKISLSLCFGTKTVKGFDLVGHVPCQPKPEVENLMLSIRARTRVCSKILKCVFWTCRPKFVTHGLLPESFTAWEEEENSDMLKLLRRTLIKKGSGGRCIPTRLMFDKYGLDKVDVEVFDDSLAEWRAVSWKVFVDASNSPEKKPKTRFRLRWI